MGLQQVVAPTSDPISLGEAKQHCRVDSVEDDGLLVGYVLAARQHAETYLRRSLLTQTWDLTLDYEWPPHYDRVCQRWTKRIVLPRPPVQSVTSITYVDDSGNPQTLAASQYKLAKIETGEWALEPAYGVTWPTIRRELAAATVRFVAGYGANPGDIPEPIRQAMLLLIGHWYEHRETVIVGTIASELPVASESLLFPHRVFY